MRIRDALVVADIIADFEATEWPTPDKILSLCDLALKHFQEHCNGDFDVDGFVDRVNTRRAEMIDTVGMRHKERWQSEKMTGAKKAKR